MKSTNLFSGIMSSVFIFCLFSFIPDNTVSAHQELTPVADFSVINNGHLQGVETIFNNQSTGALSYYWDFGDGNTSTEENPRHLYQEAGTYEVTLTVSAFGFQDTFIGTVDVIIS